MPLRRVGPCAPWCRPSGGAQRRTAGHSGRSTFGVHAPRSPSTGSGSLRRTWSRVCSCSRGRRHHCRGATPRALGLPNPGSITTRNQHLCREPCRQSSRRSSRQSRQQSQTHGTDQRQLHAQPHALWTKLHFMILQFGIRYSAVSLAVQPRTKNQARRTKEQTQERHPQRPARNAIWCTLRQNSAPPRRPFPPEPPTPGAKGVVFRQ